MNTHKAIGNNLNKEIVDKIMEKDTDFLIVHIWTSDELKIL